jgi:alpha-amylase
LADLPDLNQGNSYVRQYLKDWIKNLVTTFGFDGIRIDTIPEVPKDFWSEYGQASGVFQMGEAFNGNSAYDGDYQKHVTGLFNYPMYFTIKDVFGSGQSMFNIRNRFNEEANYFTDIDALGLFVDNHDNARFLNSFGSKRTQFKAALTFALTARGIPFFYYGSEQYFAGGNDPNNRESLWQAMNTGSDLYQMVKTINQARQKHRIWEHPQEERYVLDNIFCFNRGDFFVALTNTNNQQHIQPQTPQWKDGTKVCNIFYPTSDCQTISGGKMDLWLSNGESKIYVPASTLAEEMLVTATEETFMQE